MNYVWKKGNWIVIDPDIDLDLIATDMNGERMALSHLKCDEAAEMMGVWMAPNENMKKLISVLKSRAVKWGGRVRRFKSSRKETWIALHTNISARLKYPLPSCTLTEKEFKSIMFPAIKVALPRSVITSVIKEEMRDAPGRSGGAGILLLYHYMGTSRKYLLVEQLFTSTLLGFSIQVCIEDLTLDAGKYGSLWLIPFTVIKKYINTHNWVFVIEYNRMYNITIHT